VFDPIYQHLCVTVSDCAISKCFSFIFSEKDDSTIMNACWHGFFKFGGFIFRF